VGPFSGPRRAYGTLLRDAALLATRALAEPPTLLYFDDEATGRGGLLAAQEICCRGIRAVVGHFNSLSAAAATPLYFRDGIATWLPAATDDAVPHVGCGWIHRMCGTNVTQAAVVSQ